MNIFWKFIQEKVHLNCLDNCRDTDQRSVQRTSLFVPKVQIYFWGIGCVRIIMKKNI